MLRSSQHHQLSERGQNTSHTHGIGKSSHLPTYPLVRLLDKLNRLIACMGKEDEMQVNESIEDTLTDLACYSVMTLSYLKRKKNE